MNGTVSPPEDGTVQVRVYHNVERDSSDRPVGMMDGYQPHHPVSLVALLELPAGISENQCEKAFHLFNVGDDPEFGTPDPVAVAYRERGNRSLSVGDVVEVAGAWFACQRFGWEPIAPPVRRAVTLPGTAALPDQEVTS